MAASCATRLNLNRGDATRSVLLLNVAIQDSALDVACLLFEALPLCVFIFHLFICALPSTNILTQTPRDATDERFRQEQSGSDDTKSRK